MSRRLTQQEKPEQTIADTYLIMEKSGDVGIEYEIEFLGNLPETCPPEWYSKNDGSLRNGIEYVSATPIPVKRLERHAGALIESLLSCAPYISNRTSTHVHVNVSRNRLKGLYSLIMLYYLFENILVATQPRHRVGNLFCLRARDAETLPTKFMVEFFENKLKILPSAFRDIKYSALNILPIQQLGSIEYRFLGTSLDPLFISGWATLLHNFTQRGMMYDVEDIRGALEKDNPDVYYRIFQDLTWPHTTNVLDLVPDWIALIRLNVRYVEALLVIYDQNQTSPISFDIDQTSDLPPPPPQPHQTYGVRSDYIAHAISLGADEDQLNGVSTILDYTLSRRWSEEDITTEIENYINDRENILDTLN